MIANEPQNEQEIYFQKANDFYQEKSFKQAIVFYEKILVSIPENYKAHFNLGNAYYSLFQITNAEENFSKAVFHFKKALSYNQRYQKAYINLTNLLEENQDSETLLRERILHFFYFWQQVSYYLTSWFFLFILMIITFNIIKKNKKTQNTLPFIFIYILLLATVLLGRINFNASKAVMSKTTNFKSEPNNESLEVLKVNAGFIVSLTEKKEIGEWVLAEKNGSTGWVKKNDLMDL